MIEIIFFLICIPIYPKSDTIFPIVQIDTNRWLGSYLYRFNTLRNGDTTLIHWEGIYEKNGQQERGYLISLWVDSTAKEFHGFIGDTLWFTYRTYYSRTITQDSLIADLQWNVLNLLWYTGFVSSYIENYVGYKPNCRKLE